MILNLSKRNFYTFEFWSRKNWRYQRGNQKP